MIIKPTYIALGVVGASAILGSLLMANHYRTSVYLTNSCPVDVMLCPDGSTVPRSGKNCEFGICAQEKPQISSIEKGTSLVSSSSALFSTTTYSQNPSHVAPTKKTSPPSSKRTDILSKISSSISTAVKDSASSLERSLSSGLQTLQNQNSQQGKTPVTLTSLLKPSNIVESDYSVQDNTIVANNTVVYTIPSSVASDVGSSTSGWDSHTVNVIPVGDVAPILNAIPITGLPGKYYLSENFFGNGEQCEFANKIFILDTNTNEATLMYEENNTTLSKDDPRACTSEIFLLATEDSKLILKYHTLNTNSLCDSSWSEPEKTWYLDVTDLASGMKKYTIPQALYQSAEQEEIACRQKL